MSAKISNLPSPLSIGVGLLLLATLDVGFRYWKTLKSIRYLPGRREICGNHWLTRQILPSIPWVNSSRHEVMDEGYKLFAKHGRDIIGWVALVPVIEACIFVADPLAIKEIASSRTRFPKNLIVYRSLSYFGSNIIATEGEEWKRQRRIVAPSFNEKNNKLVWEETTRLVLGLFDVWGKDNAIVTVNNCVSDLTLPLALFIISSAGFGQRISWSSEDSIPQGHEMTFKEALHVTSMNIIRLAYLPRWAVKMSKTLQECDRASKELDAYLKEMIEERRNTVDIQERNDLFSALLAMSLGSSKDDSENQLSVEELVGNMFIFIVAGHETSSHTLSFVLGMLAIEQEEQEKMYQHILSVMPDQGIPGYESFNKLPYVLAVINETLRLFPAVAEIPRLAATDCLLPTLRPDGSVEQVFVPANVEIRINTVALHNNPRYWPDPSTFDPSRFIGNYNRDAFLPFSGGARACIGRGFSETEMVAALAVLIKHYRVELRDKEQYQGLSKLEQRRKLFPTLQIITTTPKNPIPLVFRKRSMMSG